MNKYFRVAILVLGLAVLQFARPIAAQETNCDDKDYDCKITKYTGMIKENPSDAEAYYDRGLAYKGKEQWTPAIKDFDKYLGSTIAKPAYRADGLRERGWCRHKSGDDSGAIADLTEAIKVSPDEHEAYYTRGLVYRDGKDYKSAISDFTAYVEIKAAKPEYLADGYYERGWAYNALGTYNVAIKDLDAAIALDPTKSIYFGERAYSYRKLGKTALADADEAKAAELKKPQ